MTIPCPLGKTGRLLAARRRATLRSSRGVEVETKQPGILVVHEAYYPGWFAEVDGKPARILRTNVLFRGVEVSEGRHVVVFRFQPFAISNLRDALLGLFGKSG
jgi:uncharacterized membrane protein YfhO